MTRIPIAIACKGWREVERLIESSNRPRGFFIHTYDFASVGTELLLHVRLPDGNVVELGCTVVYAVSSVTADAIGAVPGFGVRIDPGQEGDLVLLAAMAAANIREC